MQLYPTFTGSAKMPVYWRIPGFGRLDFALAGMVKNAILEKADASPCFPDANEQ